MKITINELMKSSPHMPAKEKKRIELNSKKMITLMQERPEVRNSLIRSTFYKMINYDDFWNFAIRKGLFRDWGKFQKGIVLKPNYMGKLYDWPLPVLIVFWSILINIRYYNWVKFRNGGVSVLGKKKKSVEQLLSAVMDSKNAINASLRVKGYDFDNSVKKYLIELPGSAEDQLRLVMTHVQATANFLVDHRQDQNLIWYNFFINANYPDEYNTALPDDHFKNPLRNHEINAEMEHQITSAIVNTFYPEATSGEPLRAMSQLIVPTEVDVADAIDMLNKVNVNELTANDQKNLYDALRRVKRLRNQ